MAEEAHEGAWWSTEGLGDMAATKAGRRAGDPFDDVIFQFMSETLQHTAKRLVREDLLETIEGSGPQSVLPGDGLLAPLVASDKA